MTPNVLVPVLDELTRASDHAIGYPVARPIDPNALSVFRHLAINNCGDPFVPSGYRVNTHAQEREVVRFFAGLYGLEPENAWGYVTTGGTEGNLWGIYLAREYLGDQLCVGREVVVVTSTAAHYSVRKAARMFRMPLMGVEASRHGVVNYADLERALRRVAQQGNAAVVVANIGTTMTGAIDDLADIRVAIEQSGVRALVHADAALAGLILPFLDRVQGKLLLGADTVAVSGQKILGTPNPCGVAVARRTLVDGVRESVEYIGGFDATISGSRSGLTPLALWHAIQTLGYEGLRARAECCVERASKLAYDLQMIGWPIARREYSNIVAIERPNDDLIYKWQLATEGKWAHVVALPHLTDALIQEFVADLRATMSQPAGDL